MWRRATGDLQQRTSGNFSSLHFEYNGIPLRQDEMLFFVCSPGIKVHITCVNLAASFLGGEDLLQWISWEHILSLFWQR